MGLRPLSRRGFKFAKIPLNCNERFRTLADNTPNSLHSRFQPKGIYARILGTSNSSMHNSECAGSGCPLHSQNALNGSFARYGPAKNPSMLTMGFFSPVRERIRSFLKPSGDLMAPSYWSKQYTHRKRSRIDSSRLFPVGSTIHDQQIAEMITPEWVYQRAPVSAMYSFAV